MFRHSLFFCNAKRRKSDVIRPTGSERETRPEGFDERINVYTYDFFER